VYWINLAQDRDPTVGYHDHVSESSGSIEDYILTQVIVSFLRSFYLFIICLVMCFMFIYMDAVSGSNKPPIGPKPVFVLQAWPVGTESLV
jgi:hypothetical protein